MASSSRSRAYDDRRVLLRAAAAVGDVWQAGDGAAECYSSSQAGTSGQTVQFLSSGIYVCNLAAATTILDGGRCYFNPSAKTVSYKRTSTADFYLGRAVGDANTAAAASTTVAVNVNANPRDDLDLARDPYSSIAVGTSAAGGFAPTGGPNVRGGALKLALSATNEAQKIDALGKDGIPAGLASCVVEAAFNVISGGVAATDLFSVGIASGTHATAVTSITQSLCVQLKGADTKIYAESKDGTNTVAATDTTKTYVAGVGYANRKEVWFDCRTPSSVLVYVDGVQVLSGTTFNLSAAASTWFLLAHLVKVANTDTMEVDLDWLRLRTATQRN